MDTKVNINKFVGIPYGFNQSSFDSCDCAGLAQLFYSLHGWTPNEYPKPTEKDWYTKDKFMMERFLLKNFDKTRDIDSLDYGDLLVVRIGGESHLFIYLGRDRVLTTYPKLSEFNGGASFIDRFRKYWLTLPNVNFIAGFKRRKQGDT